MDASNGDEYNDDEYSTEDRVNELEERIAALESGEYGTALESELIGRYRAESLSLTYALGMSIAVVLSWSRNASILWSALHGLFSWAYVLYFALTR